MDELSEEKGYKLERDFVKQTYDCIADDFSNTRYKKWPQVDKFLRNIPPASLLLDVGCGNGKYLDNPTTVNIGCDISLNLLKICKNKGFEVIQCDMQRLPFRTELFDSIICIAALHHIVSSKRRQTCLERIIDLMAPCDSRFLVQVWSFEQELERDNPYLKSKARLKSTSPPRELTIEDEIKLPIHKNRTPFTNQDMLVPFQTKVNTSPDQPGTQQSEQKFRYYHVFKEGELDSMIGQIPRATLIESYYDRGNWCSVIGKV